MTDCRVNDTPTTGDLRPETWGDLLESLEPALERDRRVVTAVRFDGVDQPSFRDPVLRQQALAGVARVEVEAPPAAVLLDETLTAARESLAPLAAAARRTARACRLGDPRGGGELHALTQAVQSLVVLTNAAAAVARVCVSDRVTAPVSSEVCQELERALVRLVAAQTAGDPERVGLGLEDLAVALDRWHVVLAAIQETEPA